MTDTVDEDDQKRLIDGIGVIKCSLKSSAGGTPPLAEVTKITGPPTKVASKE